MRKLPVLPQNETPTQRELRRRIDLSNRPRLGVGLARLDEVSTVLAKNKGDRSRFMKNPTGYLQSQALPVSSCTLVKGSTARTSEVCSVNALCNVNVGANVNVGVNVNAGVNINIVSNIYVFTRVRFIGFEVENEVMDMAFHNPGYTVYGSSVL